MRMLVVLLAASGLWAADDLAVFELLAPSSHSFHVTSDTSQRQENAGFLEHPIPKGSDPPINAPFDLATGKSLPAAKTGTSLRVTLPHPVPKGAETRVRIEETYSDPLSYSEKDGGLVFERSLDTKRNIIVLPKGYELVGSASPALVSTDADGRIRVSFLNDRNDTLHIRVVGRKVQ